MTTRQDGGWCSDEYLPIKYILPPKVQRIHVDCHSCARLKEICPMGKF